MALRILVADDNKNLRDELRILLNSRHDWRVVGEAVDGHEAVEKAADLQPDVVILDYSMPKLDGLSAIPMIRKHAPATEIVVLTVHDAPATVDRAIKAGARGYVVKTWIIRNLVSAIEAVSKHKTFVGLTSQGEASSG
jgi:DNA-binding NarL/FixJ family response regulator